MSTRCNVCVKLRKEDLNKDLKVDSSHYLTTKEDFPYMEIYIHHDGYVDGVGKDLYKNLTTYEDVKKYILKGDRTSYDTPYTECDETWIENKPMFLGDLTGDIPEMYYYLFDEDDEWYWKDYHNGPWKLLCDSFPEIRDQRLQAPNIINKILAKTFASEINPVKFEEIGNKIKEVIETCTNGKFTTNGESGLNGKDIKCIPNGDTK